jgi:hypothetical protein
VNLQRIIDRLLGGRVQRRIRQTEKEDPQRMSKRWWP